MKEHEHDKHEEHDEDDEQEEHDAEDPLAGGASLRPVSISTA